MIGKSARSAVWRPSEPLHSIDPHEQRRPVPLGYLTIAGNAALYPRNTPAARNGLRHKRTPRKNDFRTPRPRTSQKRRGVRFDRSSYLASAARGDRELFCRLDDIDRSARSAKQLLNHRLEGLKRHRSEIGIEGDLIEQATEFLRLLEMRRLTVLLAHIAIEPQEVEEIIPLKDIVMLDDLVVLRPPEGLDDHGRDVRVIVGPSVSPISCNRAQTTYSSTRPA
jgi:hypothetical protein